MRVERIKVGLVGVPWIRWHVANCCQRLPWHTRWAESISYPEHFDLEHIGASVLPGAGYGMLRLAAVDISFLPVWQSERIVQC